MNDEQLNAIVEKFGADEWINRRTGANADARSFASTLLADGGKGEAVAWRIFDGEGNYDYVEDEPSECNVNYAARYGRKYEPLFTAPQAECAPRKT